MTDWKNIRKKMIDYEMFETKIKFINDFFFAERKWAPIFCDHWVMQKSVAKMKSEFFETTNQYKLTVEKKTFFATVKFMVNAVTLQSQQQSDQNNFEKSSSANKSSKRANWEKKKFKNRKCVCDEVHIFRECSYIHISIRSTGWKKNKLSRYFSGIFKSSRVAWPMTYKP